MTAETERVLLLLKEVWHDNQSAMARDLGLTPTAINQVLHGKQKPGIKMLNALSRHPKVNADWILHGKGPVLPEADHLVAADGLTVPVLDWPLAGPPKNYPAELTNRERLLASTVVRETRYLLRVAERLSVTHNKKAKVAAGDLLLIETERFWADDPRKLQGKLAVVETGAPPESRLEVGLIEVQTNPVDEADAPDLKIRFHMGPGQEWSIASRSMRPGERKHLKGLTFLDEDQASAPAKPEPPLPFDAIKGVVVLLLRT